MGVWIASITGIVALTLLVDIILPDGESNKYIKAVMSVLTTLVLIQPLPAVLSENFDIGDYFSVEQTEADSGLVEELNTIEENYWENVISTVLADNGVTGAVIDVSDSDSDEFKITVNLQNVVIAENQNHIFITKLITNILEEYLGISAERITFYD